MNPIGLVLICLAIFNIAVNKGFLSAGFIIGVILYKNDPTLLDNELFGFVLVFFFLGVFMELGFSVIKLIVGKGED